MDQAPSLVTSSTRQRGIVDGYPLAIQIPLILEKSA